MSTVRVERCPECQKLIGEGMIYEHQQREHKPMTPPDDLRALAALIDEVDREIDHTIGMDALMDKVRDALRALAAAQQTPQERRTFTRAEVVALKLTRAELIDLIIGLQDTYSGRVESLGKVRGSLPDNEEGRNGSDQRHASGFKAPHEPSPVAHETPAPRPAEDTTP